MRYSTLIGMCIALAILRGHSPAAQSGDDALAALRKALTFHASFDKGPDADFGAGDRKIYTAASYKSRDDARSGLASPDVTIAAGKGRFGDALHFLKKNTQAVYYLAEKNLAYWERDWNGTVSFWLSLTPDEDLAPGYSDPIQITDTEYNNAAIWVDFTRDDKPRNFRLGIFGDLKVWNPKNLAPEENPFFNHRTLVVMQPPFARGNWTHVVITYAALNTQAGGTAKLYLNGSLQGTVLGIHEPFTWNVSQATIRLGVNYVGLWDDLSVFDHPLTDEEVAALYQLKEGVWVLHK